MSGKNITIPLSVAEIARRGVEMLLDRAMDEADMDGANVPHISRSQVDDDWKYVDSLTAAAKTLNEKIKEAAK